ncbi:MAG TPA: aminotransferase class I/II-fold pyridoxal phosphate-dependent enzyme [Vicinamibacterales bacterium]
MSAKGFSTTLIHRGEGAVAANPLTTPIYETTTYVFENADAVRRYNEGGSGQYLYSRYENPTVVAVEQKLAAADGAEQALVFSSGMAATSTILLALLKAGDEVVCGAAIYGGTFHLLEDFLPKFGVVPRFTGVEDMREPERVITDRTRIFWFESPNNPHLRCVDVKRIAQACRARGVVSIIDNTFASPLNQRPLAMGVDLAMQSATKYLNGHSDVTAGVVSGSTEMIQPVAMARRKLGGILDPQAAYALNRALKTLEIRVQRHNANAMAVASALEAHPAIARVYYPGLSSHPDHALAKCQMTGFGGMVCIDLSGGEAAACRAFDRLKVVKRAASLGGTESLCSLPILTSQWGHTDEQLKAAGISRGMMRLSIGLEDPQDLIDDLKQALA